MTNLEPDSVLLHWGQ